MDYNKQIELLKSSLETYSADEERLKQLYKNAIANLDSNYATASKNLEKEYKRNRNEAYSDSARNERNLLNSLAARGLGFSGEAAQTKLNSNILLSNRLGDLALSNSADATKLKEQLAENKQALEMEQADKINAIRNNKNKLNAEITGIIMEKEAADKKLAAEKEMLDKKLKAEKELQEAELKAKYESTNNKDSGNKGSYNTETENGENEKEFDPPLTAKEMAKQIISTATGGRKVESDEEQIAVGKYIMMLTDKYGADSDYMDDLLFILSTYGYKDEGDVKRRVSVISNDAIEYYDAVYDELYESYVSNNYNEGAAIANAAADAEKKQMEFIYKNTKNLAEFKSVCKEIGISNDEIADYIREIQSNLNGLNGAVGGNIAIDKLK